MIVFRSVNALALGFFGPLFYLLPLAIYGILKLKTKNKPIPEGFASFERRGAALIIDFILIEGLAVGMQLLCSQMADPPVFWGSVLVFGFAFTNMVILPARTGWSLGKRVVGIKIVTKNDSKVGLFEIWYREIVKSWFSLSVLFLGCFWMMIGKAQLAWHDSIADTRVIRMKGKQANKALVDAAP